MSKIGLYTFFGIVLLLFLSCQKKEQDNTVEMPVLLVETVFYSEESVPSNEEPKNENSNTEDEWVKNIKEFEVVNGTWVSYKEFLLSTHIVDVDWYSWGTGRSITETSMEIDLGKKDVLLPGAGLYKIGNVYKNENEAICLTLFYINDRDRKFPLNMELSLIDYQSVYVVCYPKRESFPRYLSETPWIWYRLSGPEQ